MCPDVSRWPVSNCFAGLVNPPETVAFFFRNALTPKCDAEDKQKKEGAGGSLILDAKDE